MMQCPGCQGRAFTITAKTTVKIYATQHVTATALAAAGELEMTGSASHEDMEWDGTSACTCDDCGHTATVADFGPDDDEEEAYRWKQSRLP